MSAATDYWANFGDLSLVPADSQDLVNYGWVESGTWATLAGSDGDLLSSADRKPAGRSTLHISACPFNDPHQL